MAKVLIVVLALLVVSVHCGLSPEMEKQVKQAKKMVQQFCQSQFKITDALIDEALKTKVIPTDQNFKCFLHCTLEISRLMTDDQVNFETVRRQAEVFLPDDMKEPILKSIDTCNERVKVMPDKCDTAYNIVVCFQETSPDGMF